MSAGDRGKLGMNRTTTRTRLQLCPHCGGTLDAASPSDNSRRKPKAGDVSICLHCAEPLMFVTSDTHRLLTEPEIATMRGDPSYSELFRVQDTLLAMKRAGFQTAEQQRASKLRQGGH